MKVITAVKVPNKAQLKTIVDVKVVDVSMPIEFSNEKCKKDMIEFMINDDPNQIYAIDLMELNRITGFYLMQSRLLNQQR